MKTLKIETRFRAGEGRQSNRKMFSLMVALEKPFLLIKVFHKILLIFILVLGEEGIESGIRDEISDRDGKSFGWLPRIKLTDCVHRGIFRLRIQMLSVNTVKTYFSYIKSEQKKTGHVQKLAIDKNTILYLLNSINSRFRTFMFPTEITYHIFDFF